MYEATYRTPQHLPTKQEGSNLRALLRCVRTNVALAPAGTTAEVEHVQGEERFQVALFRNVEGRLKKEL